MSQTLTTVFRRPPSLPCFDAGTEFCPCPLAELGHCVACSVLRGENRCDCGWGGVCIYEEFLRNGRKAVPVRREWEAQVIHREEIVPEREASVESAFWFRVRAPEELTRWFVLPGSFAFVRIRGRPEMFNVPLSAMDREGDILTFACEVLGPKTRDLRREIRPGTEVILKGPFWSGVQGLGAIRAHPAGKSLIVAKGIGQAPAVFLARYLKTRGGAVKALLGPGSLGAIFIEDILAGFGVSVVKMPKEPDHNLGRIVEEITSEEYDLVVSSNARHQHKTLWRVIANLPRSPAFAWVSDVTMNCGEGLCGACLGGRETRLCKAVFDAEEFFA
ncbi:MAG: hypothetical protein IMW97_07265 [Firmicutes bacterium]|nr:hypothetical protein [Candidatus Fermentithermobacillaceae bacterium]